MYHLYDGLFIDYLCIVIVNLLIQILAMKVYFERIFHRLSIHLNSLISVQFAIQLLIVYQNCWVNLIIKYCQVTENSLELF